MTYRFYRKDFGPLELQPLHYDLLFDVAPERVRVTAKQTYLFAGEKPTSELKLNAHNLTIESVARFKKHSILGKPPVGIGAKVPDFVAHVASLAEKRELKYEVKEEERFLMVQLDSPIAKGQEIAIETVSVCHPTDNVLEGIYYDYTPEGAPQQMITQCQQYGFQRIVPCIDRMPSKTFYTTTIVADKRYTSLISNGDLAPGFVNPQTKETVYQEITDCLPGFKTDYPASGPARHVVRYYNHKVNMAPYLFFLGCGTYEVFKRELEYPDGSTCMLELLGLPGIAEEKGAWEAVNSLHNCILWTYLSTGPEATLHEAVRKQQYDLVKEREELKAKKDRITPAESKRLQEVRAKLKANDKKWTTTGYKYTGSVYREIAMENSNYGGMENVGNTTIVSSKLCPTKWMLDGGYVYMEGVKVHEFYHNINGSQVTGQSPFEIWLNEAVTVHIQRQYENRLFGADYMRLEKVNYAFTPGRGPLAEDRKPNSMAIEPVGFNTTHELISAMTYSKAPEFVRMVQLILGDQNFDRALHNYHSKFAFSNAKTEDWINCMAELAPKNIDLHRMAEGWLKRTGYPTVTVKAIDFDEKKQEVRVRVKQSGFENQESHNRYPWIVPLDFSLVKGGKAVHEGLHVLTKEEDEIVVGKVTSAPEFVSVGRNWSFFGEVNNEAFTPQMLEAQAMSDPDTVNRYLAFQSMVDEEKAVIIQAMLSGNGGSLKPSKRYLELYNSVLTDSNMSPMNKAFILRVSESISSRPDLQHRYKELSDTKKILLKAVYDAYGDTVLQMYDALAAKTKPGPQIEGLADRSLKGQLLKVLARGLPKEELLKRLKAQLNSPFMTDKLVAFLLLLELPEPQKSVMAEVKKEWMQHPIGCEQYIFAISNSDSANSATYIRELLKEGFFNMSLAGHARTVARGWASNRKLSLLTDAGLDLTVELIGTIGKVNQMSAYALLSAFGDLEKFEGAALERLVEALKKAQKILDKKEQQSLYNQLDTMLQKYRTIEEAHAKLPVSS